MITRDFFQLVLVNHLDGYLFTSEHMPGHLNDSKVTLTERLLQVIHTSDVATIMLGRSYRVRFADHTTTVLHRPRDLQTHPNKHYNHRPTLTGGHSAFRTETIVIRYDVHCRLMNEFSGITPLTLKNGSSRQFQADVFGTKSFDLSIQ